MVRLKLNVVCKFNLENYKYTQLNKCVYVCYIIFFYERDRLPLVYSKVIGHMDGEDNWVLLTSLEWFTGLR